MKEMGFQLMISNDQLFVSPYVTFHSELNADCKAHLIYDTYYILYD